MSHTAQVTVFTLNIRVQPVSTETRDIAQRINVTLVEDVACRSKRQPRGAPVPGGVLNIGIGQGDHASPSREFIHALGKLLVQLRPGLDEDSANAAGPAAQTMTDAAELASSCGLSRREQEVLAHVLAGYLNKQTAHALMISPRTVEHYRAAAMLKIGARSAADLFRMAGPQGGGAR